MFVELISLIIAFVLLTFVITVVKILFNTIKVSIRRRRYIKMRKKQEDYENQYVTKVQY